MKKVTNLFVMTAGVISIGFIAGNVFASNQFSSTEKTTNVNTSQKVITQKNRDDNDFKKEKNIFEKLNLSTSQQEQMKNIRDKYQPQIQTLRQEMRVEKEKLGQMMETDTSESQLRNQHKNVLQISQKMRNQHFEAMLEMREVLTTQQRQELSEAMDNRRSWKNK